jgi:hypothetical protein
MYEKGVKAGCEWVANKKWFDRRAVWRLSNLRNACRDEDWDAYFIQNGNDAQATGERIFSIMWPNGSNGSTAGEFWEKVGSAPSPSPEFVRGFAEGVVEACLDMTV